MGETALMDEWQSDYECTECHYEDHITQDEADQGCEICGAAMQEYYE